MLRYKLSSKADEDLENIFGYGVDNFGVEQAIVFYNALNEFLSEFAKTLNIVNLLSISKQVTDAQFLTLIRSFLFRKKGIFRFHVC